MKTFTNENEITTTNARQTPTLADVSSLKERIAGLGRDTTEHMSKIADAILTLASETPTNDPEAMFAGLTAIAALGVEFAESWENMISLAAADKLTDMCEAALAAKAS